MEQQNLHIKKLSEILANFIFENLAEELLRQGHKLTGALSKSFEAKIEQQTEKTIIKFLMLSYGLSLNNGISPARIPFAPVPPYRGGKSKYIQGLIKFAQLKFGVTKKKAKGIAFAIATKQKQKGYPLTRKTGFIDNVLKANERKIEQLIENFFQNALQKMLIESLNINKK